MTTIKDTEKIILTYCIKNASAVNNSNSSIPAIITNKLLTSKFQTKEHKQIYSTIKTLVERQISPTIPNILMFLGDNKEIVGGEAYLQTILKFGDVFGLQDFSIGYEPYVNLLDDLGNLKELIELTSTKNLQFSKGIESLYHDLQSQDLTSYDLIENIIDEIQAIIKKTQNSGYVHISTIGNEFEEHLRKIEEGIQTSFVPTGFPSLAKFMFPKCGVLSVIQADTNAGKSTFGYLMALGTAIILKENNIEGYVAINTLEDSALEVYVRLACAMQSIVKDNFDKGHLTTFEKASLRKARIELDTLPIAIDQEIITTRQLQMNAKIHSAKFGQRWLGINDYSELFADKNKNEERRVAGIANTLQGIAKNEKSAEILISQITSYQDIEYLIAGFGSTRQSKSLYHAARQVVTLYNLADLMSSGRLKKSPKEYSSEYAHLIFSKNKGLMGSCAFRWLPSILRFEDKELPNGQLFEGDK